MNSKRRWSVRRDLASLLLLSSLTILAQGRDREANLVVNGDFERGSGHGPSGWQHPDGLTSFWVKAPRGSGRAIKINTDVLASQFRARREEMAKALEEGSKPPPAPERKPTRPPKYDTVAGNDGVHFVSDRITVEPSKFYKLQVDVRVDGKASPKVWIKAYARISSRGGVRERVVWEKSLNCNGANRDWATYTMVFPRKTRVPERVEFVRVQLYPYWPPATYWFDNVRLVEIDPSEVENYDLERDLRTPVRKPSERPKRSRSRR